MRMTIKENSVGYPANVRRSVVLALFLNNIEIDGVWRYSNVVDKIRVRLSISLSFCRSITFVFFFFIKLLLITVLVGVLAHYIRNHMVVIYFLNDDSLLYFFFTFSFIVCVIIRSNTTRENTKKTKSIIKQKGDKNPTRMHRPPPVYKSLDTLSNVEKQQKCFFFSSFWNQKRRQTRSKTNIFLHHIVCLLSRVYRHIIENVYFFSVEPTRANTNESLVTIDRPEKSERREKTEQANEQ